MKKKILLPIIGLGATAAAITPMLVSCGSKNVITGNSLFIPTIEQADEDSVNQNEANILYAAHLIENPEIFVQDWMYDMSWKAKAIKLTQKNLGRPDPTIRIEAKFNNINVISQNFTKPDDPTVIVSGLLLSYELDAKIECDANGSYIEMPYKRETEGEKAGYLAQKVSLHFKSEITNLPFILTYWKDTETVVERSGWRNWFWSAYRTQAPNWEADISVNGTYLGTAENECYIYNNDRYVFNAQNDLPLSDDDKPTKTGYLWSTYDNLFGSNDYVYHMQLVH